MKNFAVVAGLVVLGLVPVCGSQQATGNGALFGTRNTRDCGVNTDSPTAAQLQQAFICESEIYTPAGSSGAKLELVSSVNLQFSRSRPYNSNSDTYSGIDVRQPVYDVKGSYVGWTCFEPSSNPYGNAPRAGKNCWKSLGNGVSGIAFRDTFGLWHVKVCCAVSADGSNTVYYPPPTNEY